MNSTDRMVVEMLKKVAKATGQPEEELKRQLDQDTVGFGDKYYEHMTPEEMKLFG